MLYFHRIVIIRYSWLLGESEEQIPCKNCAATLEQQINKCSTSSPCVAVLHPLGSRYNSLLLYLRIQQNFISTSCICSWVMQSPYSVNIACTTTQNTMGPRNSRNFYSSFRQFSTERTLKDRHVRQTIQSSITLIFANKTRENTLGRIWSPLCQELLAYLKPFG